MYRLTALFIVKQDIPACITQLWCSAQPRGYESLERAACGSLW